jgi:hypothetical protein
LTWRSIRTTLENGEVSNNLKQLQFLASIVTAYPCLDIWFRSADSNSIQIQIYYMQCDSGFVAQNSWERSGEKPRFYEEISGTWQSIRSNIISSLPFLSRLSDEKRNGLANFGAKQPYAGGGLLFDVDGSGNLVIQGRFGALRIEVGGVTLPFEALAYNFDCCDVTVTVDADNGPFGGPLIAGGFQTICDFIPGRNLCHTYEPPHANISFVGYHSRVDLDGPWGQLPGSGGGPGMQSDNWQWPAGTEIFLPVDGPVASGPVPTPLTTPATLNNWSVFEGQSYFFSNEAHLLPLVSGAALTRVYEKQGTLGYPRLATTSHESTTTLNGGPTTVNTRYRVTGIPGDVQGGVWRLTITPSSNNTKLMDLVFIPDDSTYGTGVMLDSSKSIPENQNNFYGWKAGAADGYGGVNALGSEIVGTVDTKFFDLNVDTEGDNTVPQGDFPTGTVPGSSGTFHPNLLAEQWRSTLAVSWT